MGVRQNKSVRFIFLPTVSVRQVFSDRVEEKTSLTYNAHGRMFNVHDISTGRPAVKVSLGKEAQIGRQY